MNKKFTTIGIAVGCMLGAALLAYTASILFYTKSETISVTAKTIFQFDLDAGANAAATGPGESFSVSPTIYNDATEGMYVFIVVEQPTSNSESLYTYTAADSWKLVSSTAGKQIYAYAGDNMTKLLPGETTDALTSQMTMKSISNADYSNLDDLNVTITGYGINTENVSTDVDGAWAACKQAGEIE